MPAQGSLRSLLAINHLATARTLLAQRGRPPRIFVHRKVHCFIGRGAVIEGRGRLLLGRCWENSRPLPSEFKLNPGAHLQVEGRFVIYSGSQVAVQTGARLVLGSGYINMDARMDVYEEVVIGQDVAISSDVVIRDSDNHLLDGRDRRSAPIRIGDHVWIGLRATILKGVTIGDGAVVAAGALVIRDVPPAALVGGVPAQVIRENVTWQH